MKHKLLLTLGIAVLALVGCTADVEVIVPQAPAPEGAIAINISGSIDQATTTRVNDDGFCDGDGFGLFAVNYENGVPGTLLDKGNQANNVRYVFDEQEYTWTPDYPVYYRDNITPVDMIGYYPYNGALENVNNYSFEVQQDQSTTVETSLMGGYEASDFLWGKVENVHPTDERIHIIFSHRMAGVQVELTEGSGWSDGEWASVEKHALVANTIRKASIDLATGVVTPTGEREIMDIVPAINGEYYRAVVVPQTVDASIALLRITVDGTPYLFRKSEAFEYQAGKLHKFVVKVSKKELTGVEFELVGEEVTPWESETISHDGKAKEYVIIEVPEASTDGSSALKAAIEAAGKDSDRIVNMKVIGRLNEPDFTFMRENMLSLTNINLYDVVLCDGQNIENKEIPYQAFYNAYKFQHIIIPNSTEIIGFGAFDGVEGLISLNIPNSVRIISNFAFRGMNNGCNTLTLNIPDSLEEIGSQAFWWTNVSFEHFHIPQSVRKIGYEAFYQDENPWSKHMKLPFKIILPENLEELGEGAFANTGLIGDLKIPDKIKIIEKRTFYNCDFTGNIELPRGLIEIGSSAFEGCDFTGELVLPESLVRVGERAFNGCSFSGWLVLPQNIMSIGDKAFNGFSLDYYAEGATLEIPIGMTNVDLFALGNAQVSKIIIHSGVKEITGTYSSNYLREVVCLAKTPPTMYGHSFYNTAWQGSEEQAIRAVSIQVPEDALYKYQTAQYWGDYIPSVYRDFNLDLESTCALNAAHSRKMVVRAPSEMEWSVTHKPDWVTVTPSSGSGKVEVTIAFDEMARGGGNRADSLVFKPTAYDHYKVVKVDQYDYQYDNGDVITNQTATKGNGVNIVFMGDCFDAKDIAEGYYEEIMNEAIEHFFAVEPYTTYRDYFNVYTVIGHSTDSGMPTTYKMNQETLFESQYAYGDSGFQFKINKKKCLEYACKVPTVTKDNLHQTPVAVIENSNVYGGITYMWEDNTALSVQCIHRNAYPHDFRGVIQHEVGGHAFGKLADEYIYHGDFIDMCRCNDGCSHNVEFLNIQSLGWYQNLSLNSSHYEVPWSHLIFDPQFQMYVDMYEGGFFHQRGVYRSEVNSCMNNNIPYYSAISREAIVKRIMEYAGEEYTFEKFKANDVNTLGPVPMALTRSSSEVNYTPDPMHNEPQIMGEKPELNF